MIFDRDVYSFWDLLDIRFHRLLVRFAREADLAYLTPYFTQRYFAYLDYEDVGSLTPAERAEAASLATVEALSAGRLTNTGLAYSGLMTDTTLPTPPTAVTVEGGGQQVVLHWNGAADNLGGSGLAGYRVDVSSVASFTPCLTGWDENDVGLVVSTTVTGLSVGTAYYVRVRAYDGVGNLSNHSDTFPVGTLVNQPVNFQVTATHLTSMTLAWDSNDNPLGIVYLLEKSVSGVAFQTVADVTGNSAVVNALTYGTNHTFRLKPRDMVTSVPIGSGVTVSGWTLASSPVNTTLSEIHVSSAVVRWERNGNPRGVGYEVEVLNNEVVYDGARVTVTDVDAPEAVVTRLRPETAYEFRVRAKNGAGVVTVFDTVVSGTTREGVALETAGVYPNPYRGEGLMTFGGMKTGGTVTLYTARGQEVFTGIADGNGDVKWDGRNKDGEPVASGVYMSLMETEDGWVKKKIVLER